MVNIQVLHSLYRLGWLLRLEQHSYRTIRYTVVNIQCEHIDTYAEDYIWL